MADGNALLPSGNNLCQSEERLYYTKDLIFFSFFGGSLSGRMKMRLVVGIVALIDQSSLSY